MGACWENDTREAAWVTYCDNSTPAAYTRSNSANKN